MGLAPRKSSRNGWRKMSLNPKRWIIVLAFSMIGGIISRWHGGGFIGGSPKIIKNLMWGSPFGLVVFLITNNWWLGLAALAVCAAGKATGHGRGMSLLDQVTGKPERLEFIVSWLYGRVSDYWYQFSILSVAGAASVFGGVITLSHVNPLYGLILAVCGLIKGAAYAIGWKIYPNGIGRGIKDLSEATQIGEFLSGVFAYSSLGLVALLAIDA